jgi:hypothetical protein
MVVCTAVRFPNLHPAFLQMSQVTKSQTAKQFGVFFIAASTRCQRKVARLSCQRIILRARASKCGATNIEIIRPLSAALPHGDHWATRRERGLLEHRAVTGAWGTMPVSRQRDRVEAEARDVGAALQGSNLGKSGGGADPPATARWLRSLHRLRALCDVSEVADGRVAAWVVDSVRPLLPRVLQLLGSSGSGRAAAGGRAGAIPSQRRQLREAALGVLSVLARGCGAPLSRHEADAALVFRALLHHADDGAAGLCLRAWLGHVHAGAMATAAVTAYGDAHNQRLREWAMRAVGHFLEEWTEAMLRRHLPAFERVIAQGLVDRTPSIRPLSRHAETLMIAARDRWGRGGRDQLPTPSEVRDTAAVAVDDDEGEGWAPLGMVQMQVTVADGGSRPPPRGGGAQRRRAAAGAGAATGGGADGCGGGGGGCGGVSALDRTAEWVACGGAISPPSHARGLHETPARSRWGRLSNWYDKNPGNS